MAEALQWRWGTFAVMLIGFGLRLHYLTTAHPFFDEYTTVLAARETLRHGWPVLPSGLFYEHGLLATYLIAPFAALFTTTPLDEWQSAHWGLMLARWPSVLVSMLAMAVLYRVARLGFKGQPAVAFIAVGLFALSPEGVVWGARARMYALATLLVLLTVYLAYRGATEPGYRWLALLTLGAALLTQFGVMLVVPPLLIALVVLMWPALKIATWLPCYPLPNPPPSKGKELSPPSGGRLEGGVSSYATTYKLTLQIIAQLATLGGVIALAVWVKRLGQPLGMASPTEAGHPLLESFLETVAYQVTLHFTWTDTVDFLARQFGVSHHLWLAAIAIPGGVMWLFSRRKSPFVMFLWLVLGLTLVETVTLLEPFRRNPRYLVLYLPLFYLLVGFSVAQIAQVVKLRPSIFMALTLPLIGLNHAADLRVALITPEPAYQQAMAYVFAQQQPGDKLLTMNTPAAALYLNRVDGFTVQDDAAQFLLRDSVDRWTGSPWVGTMAAFVNTLNHSGHTWFVIDTIRQPVYFRGDWNAVVHSQMDVVWQHDNALVYRTKENRVALPTQPETHLDTQFGDVIRLTGYSLESERLTLFWEAIAPISADYTVFLHLRDDSGATVAQRDRLPLDGVYPTYQWQPGEAIIDPIALPADLPAGQYTLWTGLYALETLQRLPVQDDSSGENAVKLTEVTYP